MEKPAEKISRRESLKRLGQGIASGLVGLVLLGSPIPSTYAQDIKTPQKKEKEEVPEEYRKLQEEVLTIVERYATKTPEQIQADPSSWIIPEYDEGRLIKLSFGHIISKNEAYRMGAFKTGESWTIELGKENTDSPENILIRYTKDFENYSSAHLKTKRTWVQRCKNPLEKETINKLKTDPRTAKKLLFLLKQIEENYKSH